MTGPVGHVPTGRLCITGLVPTVLHSMEPIKNFLERRSMAQMTAIGVMTAIIVFVLGVQFGGGLALIESLATG